MLSASTSARRCDEDEKEKREEKQKQIYGGTVLGGLSGEKSREKKS